MSEIDNLNFKLILDDKDFNTTIENAQKQAKDLNVSLSTLLDLSQKVRKASEETRAARKDEAKAIKEEAEALKKSSDEQTKATKTHLRLNRERIKSTKQISDLNTKIAKNESAAAKSAEQATKEALRNEDQRIKNARNQLKYEKELQDAKLRTLSIQKQINKSENGLKFDKLDLSGLEKAAHWAERIAAVSASKLAADIVRITGEFEMQEIALKTITQDAKGAERLFMQIQDLAVESPYSVLDLTTYAKQLSAFNVPLDDLFDTTKMLADVAAGLGVDMDRIILAYGQVKAATYLRGQEVRQFTEAGIPILQQLADQLKEVEKRAVSTNEVFDMISKRQIPFEMVNEAFVRMTSQGGKFFNMQSVLADTLAGKVMKLKDQYQIVVNEMGKASSGLLHGAADGLLSLLRNYEKLGKVIAGIVAGYGAWQAVKFTRWAYHALQLLQHERMQYALLKLETKELTKQAALRQKMNFLLGSNPYMKIAGAVLAALAAVTTALVVFNKEQQKAAETAKQITDNWVSETTTAKQLYDTVNDINKSEAERKDALNAFNALYGQYLNNVVTDINNTEELKLAYDSLTKSLQNNYLARLQTETIQPAQDKQVSAVEKTMKVIRKLIKVNKITGEAAQDIERIAVQQIVASNSAADKQDTILKSFNSRIEGVLKDSYHGVDLIEMLRLALEGYIEANEELTNAVNNYTNVKSGFDSVDDIDKLNKRQVEGKIDLLEKQKKALLDAATFDKEGKPIFSALQQKQYDDLITSLDKYNKRLEQINNNRVDSIAKQQKDLEKLNAKIANLDKKEKDGTLSTEDAATREELIKQADAIQKNIDAWKNRNGLGGRGGKTPQEIQIENETKALDGQLKKINAVNDAFKRFKNLDVFDDEQIRGMLKNLGFDAKLVDKEYNNEILAIADAYEKLGTESAKQKAQSLRDSVAKDAAQDFESAYNAFKRYKDAIETWVAKDFNINGEGIALKVNKAVADLNSKNNKVELDASKLKVQLADFDKLDDSVKGELERTMRELYGDDFWNDFYKNGVAAIDRLAAKEKDYNKKVAQQQVTDMANQFANEKLSGLDLTNWNDKTLAQIKGIINKLKDFRDDELILSKEDLERLKEAGITLDQFYAIYKKLIDDKTGDSITEKAKKLKSTISSFQQPLSQVGSTLTSIGDTLDDGVLSGIGHLISGLSEAIPVISEFSSISKQMADNVENGFDKMKDIDTSSIVSAIITIEATIVQTVLELEDYLGEQGRVLYIAMKSYANDLKLLTYELDDDYSTIFGEDNIAKAVDILTKYKAMLAGLHDSLSWKDYFWGGEELSIEALPITTMTANWWQKLWGKSDTMVALSDIADIWDENGRIIVDKARAFMDDYSEILNKNENDWVKTQLEYAIEYEEQLEELEEAWDDFLSDMVGNLASDMTSKMIENFKAMGDAVYDLEEPFQDLGETIVSSLMQSMIIDEILDKYKEDISNIYKGYANGDITADDLANKMGEITSMIYEDTESLGDYFNTLLSAFYDNGLLGSSDSDSSSDTLSSSIKSITENTASLLASYVNAIRADVSSMYMLQAENGPLQKDFFTTQVPTLADHLAQIQANTYNNSMNTQSILAELQSVMGVGDEGRALRVVS